MLNEVAVKEKMTRPRNYAIDAIKCIACFGVIMLHFPINSNITVNIIQNAFGRCSVPIFFLLSGLTASYKNRKGLSKWLLNHGNKMVGLGIGVQILTCAFYYVLFVCSGNVDAAIGLADRLNWDSLWKFVMWQNPPYAGHTWYIFAYAVALYVLALFVYCNMERYLLILSPILLLVYLLLGRYSLMVFGKVMPPEYASNAWFAAIPLVTLGYYRGKKDCFKLSLENKLILLVVAMFLLWIEAYSLYLIKYECRRNNYLFNIIVAFMVLELITDSKIEVKPNNILCNIGSRYTMHIYVIQYMTNEIIVRTIGRWKEFGAPYNLTYTIYMNSKPLFIFAFTLIISMVYVDIRKMAKNSIFAKRKTM